MLTQEQVGTKREELRTLQQQLSQRIAQLDSERQQTVVQLLNLQGQIDALTMVLTGEASPNGVVKEEMPDATQGC